MIFLNTGLSEMLSQHVSQFKLHSITGCDLLKLSRQQLLYLKVNQLGHQELLLEAVELLALVDNARSRQSTISLASALSKTTSQLIKALTDFEKIKDSSQHLICIEVGASILEAAKFLIGWLDRFPTELICDYFSFRLELLKSCLNLASSLVSIVCLYVICMFQYLPQDWCTTKLCHDIL
jgi:connector enhancer of kinase suppressor of Ras 2